MEFYREIINGSKGAIVRLDGATVKEFIGFMIREKIGSKIKFNVNGITLTKEGDLIGLIEIDPKVKMSNYINFREKNTSRVFEESLLLDIRTGSSVPPTEKFRVTKKIGEYVDKILYPVKIGPIPKKRRFVKEE